MSKNTSFPLITIVTPTYNAEDYIEETIQSVVNQDYPALEYLIVNDGSTDGTARILKKYGTKITVIHQKNSGEAAAVNNGLSHAKGTYVMIVNADDPLLPGAVSSAVAFMQKHKDAIVGYPDWYMIDEKSNVIDCIRVPEFDYLKMLKEHYCYIGPGAIIAKKAFALVGRRDPSFKYVGDFEFWLRLGRKGKILRIPEILATWRMHSTSASQAKKGREMAEEHVRLTKKVFSQNNVSKKLQQIARSAWSATYYHAASLHGSYMMKWYFYAKSFLCDPLMFASKVRYELVKLKRYFSRSLKSNSYV